MGVYRSQTSNLMALGYGILNIAVICDSAWSGAVPAADLVADSSLAGRYNDTPGAVSVASSSSAGRSTGRLGAVAA